EHDGHRHRVLRGARDVDRHELVVRALEFLLLPHHLLGGLLLRCDAVLCGAGSILESLCDRGGRERQRKDECEATRWGEHAILLGGERREGRDSLPANWRNIAARATFQTTYG